MDQAADHFGDDFEPLLESESRGVFDEPAPAGDFQKRNTLLSRAAGDRGSQTPNLMTPLLQPFDQMCVAGNPGTGDSTRPEGGCLATRAAATLLLRLAGGWVSGFLRELHQLQRAAR
jgi:hypothetical protein